jgi:hypothetical protein
VGNAIKKVDDFFGLFIQDEAGRFFFLHLPFWGFILYASWFITEAIGLFLIWGTIVFLIVPYFSAGVIKGMFEGAENTGDKGVIWFGIGSYAVSILALIGVPGWYFGFVLDGVQTQWFTYAYTAVIVYWWRFFNFYHDFKSAAAELKAAQAFANHYAFSVRAWQVSFLVSAVVVMPILFWRIRIKERARVRAEELEQQRLLRGAEKKKAEEEASQRRYEEQQRLREQRRLKEEKAEEERQKKIQEKINEVKGKDPWGSGFL